MVVIGRGEKGRLREMRARPVSVGFEGHPNLSDILNDSDSISKEPLSEWLVILIVRIF